MSKENIQLRKFYISILFNRNYFNKLNVLIKKKYQIESQIFDLLIYRMNESNHVNMIR